MTWRCATDGVAVGGELLLDLERATLHRVGGSYASIKRLTPTVEGWAFEYASEDLIEYAGARGYVIPWSEVRAALRRVAARR